MTKFTRTLGIQRAGELFQIKLTTIMLREDIAQSENDGRLGSPRFRTEGRCPLQKSINLVHPSVHVKNEWSEFAPMLL